VVCAPSVIFARASRSAAGRDLLGGKALDGVAQQALIVGQLEPGSHRRYDREARLESLRARVDSPCTVKTPDKGTGTQAWSIWWMGALS
jgi:hypothetical protein